GMPDHEGYNFCRLFPAGDGGDSRADYGFAEFFQIKIKCNPIYCMVYSHVSVQESGHLYSVSHGDCAGALSARVQKEMSFDFPVCRGGGEYFYRPNFKRAGSGTSQSKGSTERPHTADRKSFDSRSGSCYAGRERYGLRVYS